MSRKTYETNGGGGGENGGERWRREAGEKGGREGRRKDAGERRRRSTFGLGSTFGVGSTSDWSVCCRCVAGVEGEDKGLFGKT